MFRLTLKFILILFISLTFFGCGSSNDKETSTTDDEDILSVQSIALPSSDIYPNSLHTISIEINSQERISVDNNDSPVFFFFSLENENDENGTVWFDSDSLSLIEEGTHSYDFNLEIPSEVNASTYSLKVSLGDSM